MSELDDNKAALYRLIWGQCTNALQEVIKTDKDHTAFAVDFDCVWLLKKCKTVSAGIDKRGNRHYNLVKSLVQFATMKQHPMESNDLFRTRFDAAVLTLELTGGEHIFCSETLIEAADKDARPSKDEIAAEEQKFKAMMMLVKANTNRFKTLQNSLCSRVILGRDKYPETVTEVFKLLQKTCPELPSSDPGRGWRFRKAHARLNNITNGGRPSFAQVDSTVVPGKDGMSYPHIVCHFCNKRGHYLNQCPTAPNKKKPKKQFCQYIMNQHEGVGINKNWLLLDTASTVSVCNNPNMVSNIQAFNLLLPSLIPSNAIPKKRSKERNQLRHCKLN